MQLGGGILLCFPYIFNAFRYFSPTEIDWIGNMTGCAPEIPFQDPSQLGANSGNSKTRNSIHRLAASSVTLFAFVLYEQTDSSPSYQRVNIQSTMMMMCTIFGGSLFHRIPAKRRPKNEMTQRLDRGEFMIHPLHIPVCEPSQKLRTQNWT